MCAWRQRAAVRVTTPWARRVAATPRVHRRVVSSTPAAAQPEFTSKFSIKGEEVEGRAVYLDGLATTPVDPRVLDAMLPFLTVSYGNPHSRTHVYGWETDTAIEDARKQIADLIGADPKEIVFTSGATESNNAALKGIARFYQRDGAKNHIITTQTEHKCVLDSCRKLDVEGFDITYLKVQQNGLVDIDEFKAAIRPDTIMASVMFVNNEIGVQQPLKELGEICRENKIFFHTDGAQALGKVPIDVNEMKIDVMSLSAHKIYGPKGIGALYVRRRPRVRMQPLIDGGGQERGLRSGTLPANLVVGFGKACEIAQQDMAIDHERITALSKRLLDGMTSQLDHVTLNGDDENRYPGCVNVAFAFVEGESLLMGMKQLAVSSGSACTSASLEPSYVLRALGVDEDLAHSSIRYGIGRFTTEQEVDWAVESTVKQVQRLRDMSPLYDMFVDGIDIKSIQWSQH